MPGRLQDTTMNFDVFVSFLLLLNVLFGSHAARQIGPKTFTADLQECLVYEKIPAKQGFYGAKYFCITGFGERVIRYCPTGFFIPTWYIRDSKQPPSSGTLPWPCLCRSFAFLPGNYVCLNRKLYNDMTPPTQPTTTAAPTTTTMATTTRACGETFTLQRRTMRIVTPRSQAFYYGVSKNSSTPMADCVRACRKDARCQGVLYDHTSRLFETPCVGYGTRAKSGSFGPNNCCSYFQKKQCHENGRDLAKPRSRTFQPDSRRVGGGIQQSNHGLHRHTGPPGARVSAAKVKQPLASTTTTTVATVTEMPNPSTTRLYPIIPKPRLIGPAGPDPDPQVSSSTLMPITTEDTMVPDFKQFASRKDPSGENPTTPSYEPFPQTASYQTQVTPSASQESITFQNLAQAQNGDTTNGNSVVLNQAEQSRKSSLTDLVPGASIDFAALEAFIGGKSDTNEEQRAVRKQSISSTPLATSTELTPTPKITTQSTQNNYSSNPTSRMISTTQSYVKDLGELVPGASIDMAALAAFISGNSNSENEITPAAGKDLDRTTMKAKPVMTSGMSSTDLVTTQSSNASNWFVRAKLIKEVATTTSSMVTITGSLKPMVIASFPSYTLGKSVVSAEDPMIQTSSVSTSSPISSASEGTQSITQNPGHLPGTKPSAPLGSTNKNGNAEDGIEMNPEATKENIATTGKMIGESTTQNILATFTTSPNISVTTSKATQVTTSTNISKPKTRSQMDKIKVSSNATTKSIKEDEDPAFTSISTPSDDSTISPSTRSQKSDNISETTMPTFSTTANSLPTTEDTDTSLSTPSTTANILPTTEETIKSDAQKMMGNPPIVSSSSSKTLQSVQKAQETLKPSVQEVPGAFKFGPLMYPGASHSSELQSTFDMPHTGGQPYQNMNSNTDVKSATIPATRVTDITSAPPTIAPTAIEPTANDADASTTTSAPINIDNAMSTATPPEVKTSPKMNEAAKSRFEFSFKRLASFLPPPTNIDEPDEVNEMEDDDEGDGDIISALSKDNMQRVRPLIGLPPPTRRSLPKKEGTRIFIRRQHPRRLGGYNAENYKSGLLIHSAYQKRGIEATFSVVLDECIALCKALGADCVAIDYKSDTGTCFIHKYTSCFSHTHGEHVDNRKHWKKNIQICP